MFEVDNVGVRPSASARSFRVAAYLARSVIQLFPDHAVLTCRLSGRLFEREQRNITSYSVMCVLSAWALTKEV